MQSFARVVRWTGKNLQHDANRTLQGKANRIMSSYWYPRAMRVPPRLVPHPPGQPERSPQPKTVLLVNPFYPKDPHASFGKHVLTPSLALTSIAGNTPEHWQVSYWDENLLQGPPPADPIPQVVGITVHLTFAARAYELAKWFRQLGSTIVMGGLPVISNPDAVAPHADCMVSGE